ncbi:MAG TPA: GntR family transcriptional regulator [Burkholderiaceae bacterium]
MPPSRHKPEEPAVPRYRLLADALRQTIERGELADNSALPSERDIAETHAVSRDTVRKAVRYLEERGVIYSDHGRGTFVAPALVRRMSRFLDSFSQDTGARGGIPGQQIVTIETTAASMAVAGLLGIAAGDPLIRIKRIRTVNGAMVGLQDAHLVVTPGLAIDRAALEKAGSLYKLLAEHFGIVPAEAIENLCAAPADADDAALLKVERGSPLLVCERVTFSERRQPIEYCLMKYLPSYRYSARVSKHSFQN